MSRVPEELLLLAADLRRRDEPFVLATVVRCEPPTSAKPGAKALIRADGTLSGWVGGACAEPVVLREALRALRDGQPRLIGLIGEGAPAVGRTEGMLAYPMACHSGGTLEIYVEPYLPKPLLVLVGHGPVIETLAVLAGAAEYAVTVVPAQAMATQLATLRLTRRDSLVVATHGDADEDAVEQALSGEAGYVSLVASRKRAAAVLDRLASRGMSAEHLARLKAPAGLDIGAARPAEIAVSILAEIIQHQHSQKPVVEPEISALAPSVTDARDPVCGMLVEVATAKYRSEVSGRPVYFCCSPCKQTFDRDPERYPWTEPHRSGSGSGVGGSGVDVH